MTKPTLVVMAAGMGSRYGGLKQIDPVGPSGEKLMDYSVYDAIKAGCGKIVFVIKEEMDALFRESVGDRVASKFPVEYAYQRLDDLPEGSAAYPGRKKPWGTAHAVYCCREIIREPFMAINADDFYGAEAYERIVGFLNSAADNAKHNISMPGYLIQNTLTEHGSVTRGVCEVSGEGYLEGIAERMGIERKNGQIVYAGDAGPVVIAPGTVASMNFWGFSYSVMQELESSMSKFLADFSEDLESAEFFLPYFVNELINNGKADVKVLETGAKWHGVTYREDKPAVQKAIREMINEGKYPETLW